MSIGRMFFLGNILRVNVIVDNFYLLRKKFLNKIFRNKCPSTVILFSAKRAETRLKTVKRVQINFRH
jgi:hypothetical protein